MCHEKLILVIFVGFDKLVETMSHSAACVKMPKSITAISLADTLLGLVMSKKRQQLTGPTLTVLGTCLYYCVMIDLYLFY